jgi:hypothetical protein
VDVVNVMIGYVFSSTFVFAFLSAFFATSNQRVEQFIHEAKSEGLFVGPLN